MLPKSMEGPHTPNYWKDELKRNNAGLTYRIKTLYGLNTILTFIEDVGKRKQAEDSFLYLMT